MTNAGSLPRENWNMPTPPTQLFISTRTSTASQDLSRLSAATTSFSRSSLPTFTTKGNTHFIVRNQPRRASWRSRQCHSVLMLMLLPKQLWDLRTIPTITTSSTRITPLVVKWPETHYQLESVGKFARMLVIAQTRSPRSKMLIEEINWCLRLLHDGSGISLQNLEMSSFSVKLALVKIVQPRMPSSWSLWVIIVHFLALIT